MTQKSKKPIPRLLTLHAVTFLHPGTGQTTGVVDLPVQREVHTRHPMYAASGLKGALRAKAELIDCNKNDIAVVFGGDSEVTPSPDSSTPTEANPSAGSLTLTDARILAFPVRSLQKVFVWVTCPMVILRMLRDMKLIGYCADELPDFGQSVPADGSAWAVDDTWINPLVLEEIALQVSSNERVFQCAKLIDRLLDQGSGFRKEGLILLNDTDFRHFVENATQISARIKLNDNKTTTGGGGNLWYEETLPPETILYSLVLFQQPRQHSASIDSPEKVADKLAEWIQDGFLQIGGNETVGQGWCRAKLTPRHHGANKS